jgi:hypothetical protein
MWMWTRNINTVSQEEMSMFWEVILSVIFKQKSVYVAYMCRIPNGFRERAISLYSCKIFDKEILLIVSNIGIYFSIGKVGTVYLHFRKFHRQHQPWHNHRRSRKRTTYQHIRHLWRCTAHFAQHSYNVTINSRNGQLTLHTDSHASYSCAVRREWRKILGSKSKLLCS